MESTMGKVVRFSGSWAMPAGVTVIHAQHGLVKVLEACGNRRLIAREHYSRLHGFETVEEWVGLDALSPLGVCTHAAERAEIVRFPG